MKKKTNSKLIKNLKEINLDFEAATIEIGEGNVK